MAREQFVTLVSKYCDMVGIKSAADILNGSTLNIGGVQCSLDYRDTDEYGRILIFCDCGSLPDLRKEEVYQQLLTINLFMFVSQGTEQKRIPGTFTYSPLNQHVFLTDSYSLKGFDAKRLDKVLQVYAKLAHHWKSDYFLEENSPDNAMKSDPAISRAAV